jgi:hypothetical protein
MLIILAKLRTDEKIAVYVPDKTHVRLLQQTFKNLYGGEWILVDEVFGSEFIKFNDGKVYNGFEPGQADNYRYSDAIKSVFDRPTTEPTSPEPFTKP